MKRSHINFMAIVALLFGTNMATAVTLSVDINTGTDNQAGFESLTAADVDLGDSFSRTYGSGISVDIDLVGAVPQGLETRDRGAGQGGGTFNNALRDFVFSRSDATDEGLSIDLAGLEANRIYPVTIWSWDTSSPGVRTSSWSANDGGGTQIAKAGYSFDGNSANPVDDSTNRIEFNVQTDGAGAVQIVGTAAAPIGPCCNTFVNAFEIGDALAPEQSKGFLEFKIDINGQNGPTAPGFSGLNVPGSGTDANGAFITVDGVTFTVGSADGSRNRANGNNPITQDFIFDDGAGQASLITINDLPDGIWEAQVFAFDAGAAAGDQIVGITQFAAGPEIIFTTDFASNENDPFTFIFDSSTLPDGFAIFTRENNAANRSRLNAIVLTQIVPEPTTGLLALMGLAGLAARRRRAA